MDIRPGERFTLKRKFFKLFGETFYILNPQGQVVAYSKLKAFRLKEDIRIYTDESMSKELVRIGARSILDFSTTYDVLLPSGEPIGSFRRKGMSSTFFKDAWLVFNPEGRQIGSITERGSFLAFARKWVDLVSLISPQQFDFVTETGSPVAHFRQHFNLLSYRLGISMLATDDELDGLMILAGATLIGAIEGRQSS